MRPSRAFTPFGWLKTVRMPGWASSPAVVGEEAGIWSPSHAAGATKKRSRRFIGGEPSARARRAVSGYAAGSSDVGIVVVAHPGSEANLQLVRSFGLQRLLACEHSHPAGRAYSNAQPTNA